MDFAIIIVIALTKNLILFYLGKLLTRPTQLKFFLGLNNGEQTTDYEDVATFLKNIGSLIMILAIIKMIITVLGSLEIF